MAYDAFMKIQGITGESTASGMSGAFELFSFSWGGNNPVTIGSGTGGIAGGKVSLSSFNIMKKTDSASTYLFNNLCTGQHIASATVTLRKATGKGGQANFLVYTFSELMVESIQWSGASGGDDSPSESVSFAYGAVTIQYTPQKPDGSMGTAVNASWDQTKVATS